MHRVYISGKITGTTDYIERFAKAEKELKDRGYEVINPAEMCRSLPRLEHSQYMQLCMIALSFCDSIYMLDGWQESKGAWMEYIHAKDNDYIIGNELF